ncbi:hypothetical protein SAMN00790413_01858 [Deinococcus hopiensis KR-140]|uniref:Uncharacterized protein n=1 Tax=Deinococcus hopiensis KR-140 TaxID=695939 RepID=A0A1W1VIC5_9DEIO|nr:hypothetical protein SAMN00790413_01858 [Deinococcus hopiensis KR-140]
MAPDSVIVTAGLRLLSTVLVVWFGLQNPRLSATKTRE